ncbi:Mitochondrial import inner membrane translocase subunit tim23 [Saxophila tyrrhenica]|uniref:Mitochondrial import inner membrane translocase subunit tim23 n=1 Tax=Saxophila tyrrhenica TaxID=1690608 RepID=A0AAV9PP61_9PEZI|nr:Mitochondrial import inner membrane translocase subunit tim23 [Saxophila tyrrhenica]
MGVWDAFSGKSSRQQTPLPSDSETIHDPAGPVQFNNVSGDDVGSFMNPGSFDPAALHPLAGLDRDTLDYLSLDDSALSDLPGGRSVLPSRGWSDDLCYGTGVTYLSALAAGGAWGLVEGLNRLPPTAPPKLRLNSALNAITRRGPFLGNSAGVVAMMYNGINSTIGYYRGKHDSFNSVAAGGISGMIFKSTRGVKPMLISGSIVGGIAGGWADPTDSPMEANQQDTAPLRLSHKDRMTMQHTGRPSSYQSHSGMFKTAAHLGTSAMREPGDNDDNCDDEERFSRKDAKMRSLDRKRAHAMTRERSTVQDQGYTISQAQLRDVEGNNPLLRKHEEEERLGLLQMRREHKLSGLKEKVRDERKRQAEPIHFEKVSRPTSPPFHCLINEPTPGMPIARRAPPGPMHERKARRAPVPARPVRKEPQEDDTDHDDVEPVRPGR